MSEHGLTTHQLRRLLHFRGEALLRAEYIFYSRTIQTSTPCLCKLDEEEWNKTVRQIEIELMLTEAPELAKYNLEDYYAPLRIFFDCTP